MEIEIINSHFSALETKALLQDSNIPFKLNFQFNTNKGELADNKCQVLITINSLSDLFMIQQEVGDIIISDYQADDGTITTYLLIYDDYLE